MTPPPNAGPAGKIPWLSLALGALVGAVLVWVLAAILRGEGATGLIPGVETRLRAIEIDAASHRAEELGSRTELLRRIAALEGGDGGGVVEREEVRAAIAAIAAEVSRTRASAHADLSAAQSRLEAIEVRLREVEASLGAASPRDARPMSEDEEAVWVSRAKDSDPLRRFSALVVLGRSRTDRSLACTAEALHDSEEYVLSQALRNLGGWQERSLAGEVAALLDHRSGVVRQRAFDALCAMGAPRTNFDAAAAEADRRAAAETLRKWAQEP